MKKEALTLQNIRKDLSLVSFEALSNAEDWRIAYISPITILAVLVGILSKNIWLGLAIFSLSIYHIVKYVQSLKEHKAQKNSLIDILNNENIAISVEEFSHISTETIYEPHHSRSNGFSRSAFRRSRTLPTKTITLFYFKSCISWRMPDVLKHYDWSKEYNLSSEGLKNISVEGNEFFYVSLQGHPDVAYVYPCKFFELDKGLEIKE